MWLKSENKLVYLQADKCTLEKTLYAQVRNRNINKGCALTQQRKSNNNKINNNSNAKQRICQSNRRIA